MKLMILILTVLVINACGRQEINPRVRRAPFGNIIPTNIPRNK